MPDTPKIDVTPEQWKIVHRILLQYIPKCRVWVFGSRATFTAKTYSDLDLVIWSHEPISWDILTAIKDDLSDSDLPFRVDVVDGLSMNASFQSVIDKLKDEGLIVVLDQL